MSTESPIALYSRRASLYGSLIRYLGYQNGIERVFRTSMAHALLPRARVLDAGCGAGVVTFALLKAYERLGIPAATVDGFDITPEMLERFREHLRRADVADVRLAQADVLDLQNSLPADWAAYDLIVSSAMLEYVPRDRLPDALSNLRRRLGPAGTLLLFISRRGLFNGWAMERWWQANCYDAPQLEAALKDAGFTSISFHQFPAPYGFLNSWGHCVEARGHAAARDNPTHPIGKTGATIVHMADGSRNLREPRRDR